MPGAARPARLGSRSGPSGIRASPTSRHAPIRARLAACSRTPPTTRPPRRPASFGSGPAPVHQPGRPRRRAGDAAAGLRVRRASRHGWQPAGSRSPILPPHRRSPPPGSATPTSSPPSASNDGTYGYLSVTIHADPTDPRTDDLARCDCPPPLGDHLPPNGASITSTPTSPSTTSSPSSPHRRRPTPASRPPCRGRTGPAPGLGARRSHAHRSAERRRAALQALS